MQHRNNSVYKLMLILHYRINLHLNTHSRVGERAHYNNINGVLLYEFGKDNCVDPLKICHLIYYGQ